MLVKINTSLIAGMAVTLATSSNIGASAGMLRKTLAEKNDAAFNKDDEDAGLLDDVFTDPKKKQDDPTVATGIANNNANSKAATTTVTLSEDSNVVHPNDAEAKKDNHDIRGLIDDVFTDTKKKATIANTGSKMATTIITKDSGMKKKAETSNAEAKAKKDLQDLFVPGNAKAGVVMKDGRQAAGGSPVDINIEAEEVMTADSKGTSDIAEDKVKKEIHDSAFDSSKDKSIGTTVSRRHMGSTNHVRTKEELTDGTLKDLELKEEFESDVVDSKIKKDVRDFASNSSEDKSIGTTESHRHLGSTNHVRTKKESTDGLFNDLKAIEEYESDVIPSVDVQVDSGVDFSDLSEDQSKVGKDNSIMPNMAKQDSGIVPRSLHDDSPSAKMNLRRIYDPFHAKNAHKFSDDQLYRMLANCTGSGTCMNSPNSCIKDGSCTQDGSCSNSPNLLVEEDACSGPFACSNSSSLAVGMESCTSGVARAPSCFESSNGCIGQRSCLGQYGACTYSPGIVVGDDSCLDYSACNRSPDATIKQSSCHGNAACVRSPNITVDKYSCRGEKYACRDSPGATIGKYSCREVGACRRSPGATIGKYACNCPYCCRWLNESCKIPDFQCNNGSVVDGDCSFSSTNYGCPDFP